jgi:hypothetical protein
MGDPSTAVAHAVATLLRELTAVNVGYLERGDFERAQEFTGLLRDLKRLADRVLALDSSDRPTSLEALASAEEPTPAPTSVGDRGFQPVQSPSNAFPRYVRRGETVVKIGLKRDQNHVYEQKLPRAQFEEVRDVLIELSRTGAEFEAKRPIDRANAPAYQVYLLLGILEEQKVVDVPSRGKYRFPRAMSVADLEDAWRRIPEERR